MSGPEEGKVIDQLVAGKPLVARVVVRLVDVVFVTAGEACHAAPVGLMNNGYRNMEKTMLCI